MSLDPQMELHWFSFSFHFMDATRTRTGSCYIGYLDRAVTLDRIAKAKDVAKMPEDSVMLSCCYLGRMTTEDFKAKEAA